MSYYAEIDKQGIVFHVGDLNYKDGDQIPENLIPLTDGNIDVLGKKYADGQWLETQPSVAPLPQVSLADVAQQLSNLEANLIIAGVIE